MQKTLLCFFCCVLSCSLMAQKQAPGNPRLQIPAQTILQVDKTPTKLSPQLKNLAAKNNAAQVQNFSIQSKPVSMYSGLDKYIQYHNGGVVVDISVKGNVSAAKADLQKNGFQVTGVYGRVISGIMPLSSIGQLENLASVQYAKPAFKPVRPLKMANQGNGKGSHDKPVPVISQGDTAQRSEIARNKYHVNGNGVKVGVLSDSYNNLGTAKKGIKQGELPGPGNPFHFNKPVDVLEDLDSGGTDEGRALLEIVHDVAPGSALAFHTAFLGEADFAQGIQDLADRGCQVIADDISYLDEPFFQDGIIAQSVDESKKKGVSYFSSAGNDYVNSYEHRYQASDVELLGAGNGTAQNFSAPGDPPVYAQPVFIPPGGGILATSFQWDESSFSASGVGSTSDLDIYLLDRNGNVVAGSASDNIASGDPIEVFGYENDGQDSTFFIVILKFAGPDPHHLKYILFDDAQFYATTPAIPGVLSGTCVGHPKAAGAIATGAAYYQQTPAYGVDPALIEPYSSYGGVPNYFDIEGNRIAPLIRKKPDLTAPDGVNTSFFNPFGYPDGAFDGDPFPNFFGTSAAAPHAAGVAALMIEAQKLNTITPDQIKGVMTSNTADMDDPFTPGFDKGFDVATGYGLIEADKAVGAVKFPTLYIKNLKLTAACSDDPSSIRNWTVINPNPFEVQVDWFLTGSDQKGSFPALPGDTVFSINTLSCKNFSTANIAVINWEDNFGFTRTDAEFSSTAKCGKDAVPSTYGQALQAYGENTKRGNMAAVYPNPATDKFNVYYSFDSNEPASVELYSQDGKLLYSNRIAQPNGLVSIPASGYNPGVYVVKLKQGTTLKTFQVLKQ
jgi:hypothetical protein